MFMKWYNGAFVGVLSCGFEGGATAAASRNYADSGSGGFEEGAFEAAHLFKAVKGEQRE